MTGNIERLASALCCAALILVSFAAAAQPTAYELALVDLDGSKEVLGLLPPSVFAPRVSPDGTKVAFEIIDSAGAQLWVAPLANLGARRPLPMVSGPRNWAPVWTPDGERLVFLVSSDRPDALFWRRADGTGDAERLIDARSAESWTLGGSQLSFITLTGNRDYGISLLDMQSRTASVVLDFPGSAQHSSNVSRDGQHFAYASNETGRYEVWVASFTQTDERHQVTHQGGGHPLWARDGGSIYFDRAHEIYRVSVEIDMNKTVAIGEPLALRIKGFEQGEYRRQFDLMPNGRQFLMLFPVSAVGSE